MSVALVTLASVIMAPQDGFSNRTHDWRIGPVVYQVFVDRFAPSKSLDQKRALYSSPRSLKNWDEAPKPGKRNADLGLYSHELEFWGGDLQSLQSKLPYTRQLGADVLYLLPIHQALTNHRYDAQDYAKIAPEYGDDGSLKSLAKAIHAGGQRLVLDGVFNHMGRTSPMFQAALSNPNDPHRDWYYFGNEYAGGYRGWAGVANLPALRIENPKVQEYLWKGKSSIVKKFLKLGADGWRLDVGFELGPQALSSITRHAHQAKEGSLVVGEILGYPSDWFPAVDAVCDFTSLSLVRSALDGKLTGGRVGRMLQQRVDDAGLDNTLRSWLHLDNHDTPRIANQVPDQRSREFLYALQMSLPGSPVLYYGSELGMTGAGDPQNRAPMRWDTADKSNTLLAWIKRLVTVRRNHSALRYGGFKALETDRLIAFVRTSEKLSQTVIVVANPTTDSVTETFVTRVGKLMSWGELRDQLSPTVDRSVNGLMTVTLPPRTIRIYAPDMTRRNGYSPYDRVDR